MTADGRQRIDKWLFFARVVKSRSLAAKLALAGRVRVNGDKTDQAADTVRVGDVLTITIERRILVYKVLDPGTRRGPSEEARRLYEDLSPPPAPKSVPEDALVPVRDLGSGRPTKKERRQIDRLRGDDGD
jgi:ribosome-associated heat shock protein Hsp15